MKIKAKLSLALIALPGLLPISARATPASDIAQFYGEIDEKHVQEFFAKYSGMQINTLLINSSGGAELPAIELADWVRKNHVTVVVKTLCASACANYVFPAGQKKVIRAPGLVMWHGSAEQKDVRELQEKHERYVEGLKTGLYSANSPEAQYVRKNQAKYEFIQLQRSRQADFFREIGVDEAICRLGQEPIAYPAEWWIATTDVMEKFGISNVSAPKNYGTSAYLSKNIIFQIVLKGKLMSFDLQNGSVLPLEVPIKAIKVSTE